MTGYVIKYNTIGYNYKKCKNKTQYILDINGNVGTTPSRFIPSIYTIVLPEIFPSYPLWSNIIIITQCYMETNNGSNFEQKRRW